MTSMRLDDVFDNGQPQARPTLLSTTGLIHSVKPLKQPRKMLLGYTDAVVFNRNGQSQALLFCSNVNLAIFAAVFYCIVDEVN